MYISNRCHHYIDPTGWRPPVGYYNIEPRPRLRPVGSRNSPSMKRGPQRSMYSEVVHHEWYIQQ